MQPARRNKTVKYRLLSVLMAINGNNGNGSQQSGNIYTHTMTFCPIFAKVEFSRHIFPKIPNTELHINSFGASRVVPRGKTDWRTHRDNQDKNSLFQILRTLLKTSSNTNGPRETGGWHRSAPRLLHSATTWIGVNPYCRLHFSLDSKAKNKFG
jgi:hypothetical protein